MIIDDIALTFQAGINNSTAVHLLQIFDTAEQIYHATADELIQRAELRPQLAHEIIKKQFHRKAEHELVFTAKHNIQPISSTDPRYPSMLRECNDYPHVLYVKGDPAALSGNMLSMVGTRKVNTYGISVCNRLVGDMAKLMPQTVIVSGLAFGVDAACHRAALAYGLRTVGVLANALDSIYPSAHYGMAQDMIRNGGAVVSELSSQDTPNKARFLQRNRIIAGMSAGTVVVQSPLSGGSMITATHVDGYNRCLMAPPSNLGEELCEGTNMLIRTQRARMICSSADILEELVWTPAVSPVPMQDNCAELIDRTQQVVYACLCESGKLLLEQIEARTGIAVEKLLEALLELEFAGLIRQVAGNKYEKFKL